MMTQPLIDTSRVWIYASEKELTEAKKNSISAKLTPFLNQWQAHGNELKAGFSIVYNHFIVIMVDEGYEPASGCSIDKLTHCIQDISKEINIDLLNRMTIFYIENEQIKSLPLSQFKIELKQQNIKPDIIFNTAIGNYKDYMTQFMLPPEQSFFKNLL